jgi:hypothetical protein
MYCKFLKLVLHTHKRPLNPVPRWLSFTTYFSTCPTHLTLQVSVILAGMDEWYKL